MTENLQWKFWPGFTLYDQAIKAMENHVIAMRNPAQPAHEAIWGMEHESVYTAGTSADVKELISPRFPVVTTSRGGRHTYHGPGQLVVYPMLDLQERGIDVRAYVRKLEQWMQVILSECGVLAEPHPERIGLWVGDAKIGAIGVRISQGVAWHGFALNVDVNLEHFSGIVPCGLHYDVTSLRKLGWLGSVDDVWLIAQEKYKSTF